jgi:hypothetical protein
VAPALLAEGQPIESFYWQKVEQSTGVRYLCRSQSDAKIPKAATCATAGTPKEYLQALAPVSSVVTIRPQTKDRYGRTVAEVFRNGQAFAYRKYLSACDRGSYLAAVAQAKQSRRGVWAVSGGIERPWD